MDTHRNTTTKVSHNQIQLVIVATMLFCIQFGDSLLVQCMENRDFGYLFMTCNSCHWLQFVYNNRIRNNSFYTIANFTSNLPGYNTSQITCMFSIPVLLNVFNHLITNLIDT